MTEAIRHTNHAAPDALHRSEMQLRALARNFPNGAVFLIDTDLRYIIADGEALATIGLSSAQLEGRTLREVLPAQAEHLEPIYRAALSGKTVIREMLSLISGRHYELRAVPIRDDAGAIYAALVVAHDISERRQVEAALRESEARFRAVFESSFSAMLLLDDHARIVDANASTSTFAGLPLEQLVGIDMRTLGDAESVAHFERHWALMLRNGEVQGEYERSWPDGRKVYREFSGKANIQPGLHFISIRDITEARRTQEALQEQRDFALQIMSLMGEGVVTVSIDGIFESVNPAHARMIGHPPDQIVGRSIYEFAVEEDIPVLREALERRRRGETSTYESRIMRADGGVLYVQVTGVPRIVDGEVVGSVAVVTDVTDIRRTKETLRDYAVSQTRLLNQLLHAQEAERRRLSMDLHDGPLQSLGVSMMALDRALKRGERGEMEEARAELRLLRQQLTTTVEEVRSVLADLSQEVLHTYGLSVALENYIERFSDVTGIRVVMDNTVSRRLPADIELLMYRLAQEALANVRKHAHAATVAVSLDIVAKELYLCIEDDGRGFNVEEAQKLREDGQSIGLKSMQQRVEAAGGRLEITSGPGRGTKLEFTCPLAHHTDTIVLPAL